MDIALPWTRCNGWITLLLSVVWLNATAQMDSIPECTWTVFTFASGATSSEGCLVKGKPEGVWKTYHPNGNLASVGSRENYNLQGNWKFYNEEGWLEHQVDYDGGKLNGLEVLYSAPNQKQEERTWEQGVAVGEWKWYHSNGLIERNVPFIDGREQGLGWEYAAEDGRPIARLDYHNGYLRGIERINRKNDAGRKTGVWLVWDERGTLIEEGPWTDGLRNGVFTFYNRQGKLDRLERYIHGELQAPDETTQLLDIRRTYHTNGVVARVGAYSEKGPEGVFRNYNPAGKLIGGEVYQNGIQVAEGVTEPDGDREGEWKLFYDTGELFGTGSYLDGLRSGAWKFFNPDSTLAQEGNYLEGKFHGPWTWYYPDGSIHRQEAYRNGLEDGFFQEWGESGAEILQGEFIDGEKHGKWFTHVNDHREEGVFVD